MNRRSGVVLVVGLVITAVAGVSAIGKAGPQGSGPPPHYIDETHAAGIDHVAGGEYPYSVGGGLAVLDCDGDGRPDLYLAGGDASAILYRNVGATGGALRFEPVHDPATDLSGVTGAYPIDIDGDGVADLVVLRNGENELLRGLGKCRFESANERWGLDGGDAFSTAFSATWEAGQSLPTMAFGNYVVNWDHPDPAHLCSDNELVRPAPDRTRYGAPMPLTPSWCALSMLFSDWDRSGRHDLRVSNDRHYYSEFSDGQEQLWQVAAGQPPRLYTAADGWVAMRVWGMGIASYDVTGDGYPEVYLTSQGDNKLQTLADGAAKPAYRDIALPLGVNASHPFTGGDLLPSTAWHPEFDDVNNDGYIDLFVSKGNVDSVPDYATRDPSDLLLGQPDGTFREVADAAGIVTFERGRGAALVDLNLDGLLDLVLVNYGAEVRLWRNVGGGTTDAPAAIGHWASVRLQQPGPNRDAIGAWLEIRVGDNVTRRELTIGGGHAGGQLGWIHVGLGSATFAEIRVQWPDGELGPWVHLDADQFSIVERDATAVQRWTPVGD